MQLPLTEPRARDAALAQVQQAANGAWRAAAHRTVEALAQTGQEFTADNVTKLMDFYTNPPPDTHDNRALGAILTQAKRKGLIKHIGYCRSQRPGNHAGPRSVWVGVGE